MRRDAKTDLTQAPIVMALRRLGCSVTSLAAIGKGVPDLLVAMEAGRPDPVRLTFLVECKTGKGKFTAQQITFMDSWLGAIYTMRSAEEASAVMLRAAKDSGVKVS